jgi:hypothetical protein
MDKYLNTFERSVCFPDNCNCEKIYINSFVAQPVSTITNLPILILGVYIIKKHFKDHHLFTLGFLILIAGFGSVILHMSFTKIGQILDFSGIGFVFAWVIFYYYINRRYYYLFLGLLISLSYYTIYLSENYRYPLVYTLSIASVITILVNERKNKIYKNKNIIWGCISFVIGFIFFKLDNIRVWCPQIRWLQGHTIWHFLVAFSLLHYYKFFKEKQADLN